MRLSAVRFGADGLVPVVTQESRSGDVLMVAFANRDALERTLATGLAHYFSRSRGVLWQKGETSSHVQRVRRSPAGLRWRHRPVPGRADRPGVSHRYADLLLYGDRAERADRRTVAATAKKIPGGHVLSRLARTIAQRAADQPNRVIHGRAAGAGGRKGLAEGGRGSGRSCGGGKFGGRRTSRVRGGRSPLSSTGAPPGSRRPAGCRVTRAGVQSAIRRLWVMGYGLRRTAEQLISLATSP